MAKLTEIDRSVLTYAARPNASPTATHWFDCYPNPPCRDTRHAKRVLDSLARRGLMEGIRASRSGRIFWWRITDAGRRALQEGGGE